MEGFVLDHRYDIEERMQQLTTSIGTRLGNLDKRIDDLKKLAISNNREIHRKPQPGLSGAEKFRKHALIKLCGGDGDDPTEIYRERFVSKATTSPAMTTVPGWAQELTATDTLDFLISGSTPSLLGRLLALGLVIGDWPVRVPYRVPGDFVGDWIIEGEPIKVERLSLAAIAPILRKLASISVFSRDLRKHSNPSIEAVLDSVLRADLNSRVDATLVDDQPADAKRPAGLLNGVTATAAGASLIDDLKALAAAIIANGATSVVYLANPVTALDFVTFAGAFPYPVLDSVAIPANRIICIDPLAFVGSLSGAELQTSETGTVHMSGTPQPLVDEEFALAAPITSLWQTGHIGMRCLLPCGWAVVPGRISFVDRA
jgi:hypothetical protein